MHIIRMNCETFSANPNYKDVLHLSPSGSGKVGIGIVSPSEKLEVTGNVKAEGLIIDLATLPIFDSEAAAVIGALSSGTVYRTITRELRIKL